MCLVVVKKYKGEDCYLQKMKEALGKQKAACFLSADAEDKCTKCFHQLFPHWSLPQAFESTLQ